MQARFHELRIGMSPSRANISTLDLCRGLARKVLGYGARTASHVVERRRMNRIRRNPAALRRALRSAARLLVMSKYRCSREVPVGVLQRQATELMPRLV